MIKVKQYLIKFENLNLINNDFILQTSLNLFILLFTGCCHFNHLNISIWFHQYYLHKYGGEMMVLQYKK